MGTKTLQEALDEGIAKDILFIFFGTIIWFLGFISSSWWFVLFFHFGYLLGILTWLIRINKRFRKQVKWEITHKNN